MPAWTARFDHDPTVIGWAITVVYGVVVVACFCAARAERRRAGADSAWVVWVVLGVALLVLGLNKQLDVQTLLREELRGRVGGQGWYADRWLYVGGVLIGVMVGVAVVGVRVLRRLAGASRNLRWAIACFGFLVIGLLLRFVRFGPIRNVWEASLIAQEPSIWHVNPVLLFELGMVGVIGVLAWGAKGARMMRDEAWVEGF